MDFNYEDRIIFKTISGSRLYKTDRPDSDYDYRGVIIPPASYFLGLNKFEQWQRQGEEDFCYYDIRKFTHLALQGNPNIIELLWTPTKQNLYGEALRSIRQYIISKAIIRPHIGMAIAHMKKFEHSNPANWKDACHVVRVLSQCISLFNSGEIIFGSNSDFLLSIRNGDYSRIHIKNIVEKQIKKIRQFEDATIRSRPNYSRVNNTIINLVKVYLKERSEL